MSNAALQASVLSGNGSVTVGAGAVNQAPTTSSSSDNSYTKLELAYFTEGVGTTVSGESWTYPSAGDWACNVYEIY